MIKSISVNQARAGMYIHKIDVSWIDNPFWKKQFKLEESDVKKLQASNIKEVYIDTRKGVDVIHVAVETNLSESKTASETLETEPEVDAVIEDTSEIDTDLTEQDTNVTEKETPITQEENMINRSLKPTSAAEEREFAAKAISESKKAVESMFQDVRMGKAVSTEAAMPIIEELTSSVVRNQGALISLVRLKTKDDYTYMHSVAVCALMIALAKQLNLSEAETRQAGLAGLMHDIGKAAIPHDVLNKPGALTDDEFELVKKHPKRGYALLKQAKVLDTATLDVCLHHHEKIDGSGYPDKLKGDEISLFAKMGAICDVYDAVTSNRPYKAGWEPGLSLQRMAQWKNHFDPEVFKAFVKSVGIYPIGTVVKLKSGHLGVVIDQTQQSLLKPLVKVFFSIAHKKIIEPMIIDLSIDTDDKIVSQEDPVNWGITDISKYWTE